MAPLFPSGVKVSPVSLSNSLAWLVVEIPWPTTVRWLTVFSFEGIQICHDLLASNIIVELIMHEFFRESARCAAYDTPRGAL
jgi:hypothetical protein